VRQLEQTLPQPLELAAEALEVVGARHRDRIGEGALAELADGSVELAQRPADAEGEDEDGDERERQEGRRLPQEAIACVERLRFECRHLAVDLGIALLATRSTSADSWAKRLERSEAAAAPLLGGVLMT